jgi:hypothetical protein
LVSGARRERERVERVIKKLLAFMKDLFLMYEPRHYTDGLGGWISSGNVEKSRQRRSLPSPKRLRVYALKRFNAQAGRHCAVLTYLMYAPRVKHK